MLSCVSLYFGIGYNVYCGILFSSVCPQVYIHITQFPQSLITVLGAYRHQHLHDLSVMRLSILGLSVYGSEGQHRAPRMHRFCKAWVFLQVLLYFTIDPSPSSSSETLILQANFLCHYWNHRGCCFKTILIDTCLILTIGMEQIFWGFLEI